MYLIKEFLKDKKILTMRDYPEKNGWFDQLDILGRYAHYVDGKIHSINDEPSTIWSTGAASWRKQDKLHREFGPALIWDNNKREYWYENKRYPEITSDLEWLMKVEELKRRA